MIGPLAEDAADLGVLLEVMAGPDQSESRAWHLDLPRPRATLSELRCAVIADDPSCHVASEVSAAIVAASQALGELGVGLVASQLPVSLADVNRVFRSMIGASVSESLDDERFAAAVAFADALAVDDMSHHAQDARACTARHRDWLIASEKRHRVAAALDMYLGSIDLLICPVAPTTAPQVDQPVDRYMRSLEVDGVLRPFWDQLTWNALATVGGLPATTVCVGRGADGLPIGAQIIARRYSDHLTITTASALQTLLRGDDRIQL